MAPRRVRIDSFLWVLCCCGGVPLIGLAKGLVTCLPVTLMCTLSVAFTTLVWLPHDIFHSYHCVLRVQFLGPNLRTLSMLLLPVPLLLWPPLATLAALLCSFLFGLFMPALETFKDDSALWTGGVVETFQLGWETLKNFWVFNSEAVFAYLTEMRSRPLRPGEAPFDVSLLQIFVALVMASLGLVVVGLSGTVVATTYLLPVTAKAFYLMGHAYLSALKKAFVRTPTKGEGRARAEESQVVLLMGLPLFIVANIVLPFVFALGYALTVLFCLGYGIGAAGVSYKQGVRPAALWMLRPPCQLERLAIQFLSIDTNWAMQTENAKRNLIVTKCIEPFARTVDDSGVEDKENTRL